MSGLVTVHDPRGYPPKVVGKRLAQQRSESIALVLGDCDEAPRGELAVVGRARGNGEHALELGGRGAGPGQLARLGRAARLEQRKDR